RLAQLPALRLPHHGGAVPEQPPPGVRTSQLRLAQVRVRSDLPAPPRAGLDARHPPRARGTRRGELIAPPGPLVQVPPGGSGARNPTLRPATEVKVGGQQFGESAYLRADRSRAA